MSQTKIEWADKVWNPITGCSPISEGCRNCYGRRMAYRLKGRYGYPEYNPFSVTFHADKLVEIFQWRCPQKVFVCSMGDMFHQHVKDYDLLRIWTNMCLCGVAPATTKHTFLILTKRPQRMGRWIFRFFGDENDIHRPCPEHIWLGVSVEDQKTADERIPILLQIPAAKRFVSCEPLLKHINLQEAISPLALDPDKLHWCILGGETGPKARPLHPDWVRSLRDQCQGAGMPFFFKGWGEWLPVHETKFHDICGSVGYERVGKKKAGRLLDGKEYLEIPK